MITLTVLMIMELECWSKMSDVIHPESLKMEMPAILAHADHGLNAENPSAPGSPISDIQENNHNHANRSGSPLPFSTLKPGARWL